MWQAVEERVGCDPRQERPVRPLRQPAERRAYQRMRLSATSLECGGASMTTAPEWAVMSITRLVKLLTSKQVPAGLRWNHPKSEPFASRSGATC